MWGWLLTRTSVLSSITWERSLRWKKGAISLPPHLSSPIGLKPLRERLTDFFVFPFLVSEIVNIHKFLAGLSPFKARADKVFSVSVHSAWASVRRPLRGHEDAALYGSVTFRSFGQGPGLLLVVDFGQKMYMLLPRTEVKWGSLFCFTVLLEPTNWRVAFVILRNDPPAHFLSWCVWHFISIRRLCYLSFLLYYVEEI